MTRRTASARSATTLHAILPSVTRFANSNSTTGIVSPLKNNVRDVKPTSDGTEQDISSRNEKGSPLTTLPIKRRWLLVLENGAKRIQRRFVRDVANVEHSN